MRAQRLAYLLRKAVSLPPHRVAARAFGLIRDRVATSRQRRRDSAHCTYGPAVSGARWRGRLSVAGQDIPSEWHEPLRLLGDQHRRHRFDQLGSGPVEVRYGMTSGGFVGRVYPPASPVAADREGKWLNGRINPSNLEVATALWQRIGNPNYQPIDWQIDFRSGYRWKEDAHFSELAIPVDTGADVKVPWELGRLQHLPQLALCAILSSSGAPGFAPAADYVGELHDQLFDFLALNPPRFGAQWMCPMDVGIRIANIVLAVDLLAGAGLGPDQDTIDAVMRAARDHAVFIAEHLEWAESRRGNHYLSNLVGLLFATSYLPSDPEIDTLLAFSAADFLKESDLQFTDDGGNFEGSTSYHCLSGELLLYGVALLAGLTEDDLARIDHAHADRIHVRPPWQAGALKRYPAEGGGETIVPPDLLDKLYRAGALARAAIRPDGRIVQIGDTDSGRLFALTPAGDEVETANGRFFADDTLDHRAFVAGVETLFAKNTEKTVIDAIVVQRLASGKTFRQPPPAEPIDHGDLDAIIAAIAALPTSRRRLIAFPAPIRPDVWQRAGFPQFGFYRFRTDRHFVAFRCAPRPAASAPLGHTHDDNLGVEYLLGDERRIDPGSFCYTPSSSERNRYRGAAAHDVVRAMDWDVAAPGAALFDLQHAAWATCLAWRPNGVAGQIAVDGRRLLRALRLTEAGLEIWDGIDPLDRLRPIAAPVEVATGYGRRVRDIALETSVAGYMTT